MKKFNWQKNVEITAADNPFGLNGSTNTNSNCKVLVPRTYASSIDLTLVQPIEEPNAMIFYYARKNSEKLNLELKI